MRIIFSLIALISLASCATLLKPEHDVIDQVTNHDNSTEEIQKIKRFAYACPDCIVGSATPESIKESGLTEYRLEGKFASTLTNTVFDIPVEYNDKVAKWVKFYTQSRSGKRSFMIHAERAGQYAPIMSEIMAQKNLPRDLIFLAMAESGFRNDAISWASAMGPWQFMSFTGKKFGLKVDWNIDQRRDPFRATVAAGDYLQFLSGYFKDWKLAFSGYNAGEGKVQRAITRYKTRDFWDIAKGRYLKPETKNYTPKIMALAIVGKNLKHFGFTGKDAIKFDPLVEFETIEVEPNSDIIKVAKLLNIKVAELRELNPEIKRWYTPILESYTLKVPVGKKATWDSLGVRNVEATDYQTYTVTKPKNLKDISRQYKVPVTVLEKINDYNRTKYLISGTLVKLPFRVGQNFRKDPMYADVFQKKPSRYSRGRVSKYKKTISRAIKTGKKISNPSVFYTVKKGDTLWTVAKRTGVGMNTIIRSNQSLLKSRMIRAGDRLAIR